MTMTSLTSRVVLVGILIAVSFGTASARNEISQQRSIVGQETTNGTSVTGKSAREQFKSQLDQTKQELQEARQQRAAENAARQLERLKTLGDKLFDIRLKVLTNQEKRIENGKCSDEAKTTVENSLSPLKTELEAKATELESATTAEQARTIIKTGIENTRIFSHWVPATRQLCIASRLLTLINGKISDIISKMETAGLDVTALKTKRDQAKEKTEEAYDLFEAVVLSPKATDANTKLQQGKTLLQEVRKLLGDIKSDIGNLRGEYNKATKSDSESNDSSSTEESSSSESSNKIEVHGTLVLINSAYALTDDGTTYTIQGSNLSTYVDKNVEIEGTLSGTTITVSKIKLDNS